MSKSLTHFAAAVFVACVSSAVSAQQRGTKEEAVAMVKAAVAHVQEVGSTQAFKDFSYAKNWYSKDLQVFAYDYSGTAVGIARNPSLVGKNLIDAKDPSGKPLIRDMIALAKTGGGWYDYSWSDPLTGKMLKKSSYVAKTPGFDGFLAVGIYK